MDTQPISLEQILDNYLRDPAWACLESPRVAAREAFMVRQNMLYSIGAKKNMPSVEGIEKGVGLTLCPEARAFIRLAESLMPIAQQQGTLVTVNKFGQLLENACHYEK